MTKQVKTHRNPCYSKSRETLSLLRENGAEPEVVLYLETLADTATLCDLLKMLEMSSARELMRQKEDLYKELNLADNSPSGKVLIQVAVENPELIERPIVVASGKTRVGRSPGQVLKVVGQDVLHHQLEHIAGCGAYRVLSGLRILWINFVQVG